MKHRPKSALPAAFSLFLLLPGSPAFAVGPPDTPQGRRMAALPTAFDGGTAEAIRAFVAANFAARQAPAAGAPREHSGTEGVREAPGA